ncbi:MAG: PorT family protein [Barnesiella sp.]|nr:PorT family protein [Barnesiella sp.]
MLRKLTTAILLATAATSFAQEEIFDNPDNRAGFGVRLSYELACPGDVKTTGGLLKIPMFGNSSGFSAGAVYNVPVWKNFYFEPGASIYYNTFSVNRDIYYPDANSASVRQWGLRIPLNFGYRFDFTPDIAVSIFTGPEFNLSFKGNVHMSVDKYNVTSPAFGSEGMLNRSDIKWRIGAAVTLLDHYYIAVSGALGLCDNMRDDVVAAGEAGLPIEVPLKMHSNLFSITLGYNF